MKIKGFALSGEEADPKLVENGEMHVTGYKYTPKEDILRIGVPPLDFTGSSQRGRVVGGEFYTGNTIEEMDKFVPNNITMRICASKTQGVFDCRGIFSPWRLKVKNLANESRREVTINGKCEWDMPLSQEVRKKWISLFHEMTLIKEMRFKRFSPSRDADTTESIIIVFTDAANLGAEQVVYAGYRNKITGLLEMQYLTSRNQILENKIDKSADKQPEHISRKELDSMMLGACLGNKCRIILGHATKMMIFCDNKTALCWTRGEPERLITYIRRRVKILNQFCSENERYYVKTKFNISDIGTRLDVTVNDCGPDSVWYNGPSFLANIDKAIEDKIVEPLKDLAPSQTEKEMLADGCGAKGYDLPEDYFVMGLGEVKIDDLTDEELKARIEEDTSIAEELEGNCFGVFSNYLEEIEQAESETTKTILTTPFATEIEMKNKKSKSFVNPEVNYLVNVDRLGWIGSVNVLSIVFKFIDSLRKRMSRPKTGVETLRTLTLRFERANVLTKRQIKVGRNIQDMFTGITEQLNYKFIAVEYLLKKASEETRKMYHKAKLRKLAFDEKGILYARSRVPCFTEIKTILNNVELTDVGIQSKIFFLGRFTQITKPIIMYFHHNVSYHGGRDSTLKHLNAVFSIYRGTPIIKSIVNKCIKCKVKNKKKFEMSMGPITRRLRYTYVNNIMFLDASGPYLILKNRLKMNLRGNSARIKVWVLHSTCAISHFSRAELMADYSTDEFLLAFTRICSITGYPSVVYLDSDTSEKKGMTQTTFNSGDLAKGLQYHCSTELRFCGTLGESHSRHGAIEARIKSFKKYMKEQAPSVQDMTFTMFETCISLVCNILNSCPLALKSRSNMESAKFITPFTFVQGVQSAERIPLGLGTQLSRDEVLESVVEFSKGLYAFYSGYISSFLLKHKWAEESPDELHIGDLVFFEHKASDMKSVWKLGRVETIEKDSDEEGRILGIKYSNSSEITYPTDSKRDVKVKVRSRITRRGTHTVSKIYSIEDTSIDDDIKDLILNGENSERNYFFNNVDVSESRGYCQHEKDEQNCQEQLQSKQQSEQDGENNSS